MGRRVLVTGLGTFWGGRVAKALEADPTVEVIVGLDTREPQVELERTEYVRSDENYSILSRIVSATQVDTIVHTFLVVDSTQMSARKMHEINVIGTMNLFAAATDSTVRNVVVKSSAYVYGSHPRDPVWFAEETERQIPPRHRVERSLTEVESYVRDFAVDNPHVAVSMLRFSNVLGAEIVTPLSKMLEAPVVPSIFGFDPRFQFVHEDDVIRAVLYVLDQDLAGVYNVAGDGLVPWSEVAAHLRQAHRAPAAHRAEHRRRRSAPHRPRHPARGRRPPQLRRVASTTADSTHRLRVLPHLGRDRRGVHRGGTAAPDGGRRHRLPVRTRGRGLLQAVAPVVRNRS